MLDQIIDHVGDMLDAFGYVHVHCIDWIVIQTRTALSRSKLIEESDNQSELFVLARQQMLMDDKRTQLVNPMQYFDDSATGYCLASLPYFAVGLAL